MEWEVNISFKKQKTIRFQNSYNHVILASASNILVVMTDVSRNALSFDG